MHSNTLHLYWLESKRNWSKRGYAKNKHLRVDFEKKQFSYAVSYFIPVDPERNEVEVKHGSDIIEYKDYLVNAGFTEVESL